MKPVIERVLDRVVRVPFSGCWIFTGATNDSSKPPRNLHIVGSAHPGSKLTEQQVLLIRDTYRKGFGTQQDIAKAYGVARQTISKIVNNQRFKHV